MFEPPKLLAVNLDEYKKMKEEMEFLKLENRVLKKRYQFTEDEAIELYALCHVRLEELHSVLGDKELSDEQNEEIGIEIYELKRIQTKLSRIIHKELVDTDN